VRDSLGERQPHILDAGPCVHGIESTIIDLSDPDAPARILRHGPVTREMIETALGEIVDTSAPKAATEPSPAGLPAPGLLKRHYSPQTPVTLLSRGTPPPPCADNTRQAWVLLKRPRRPLQKPERTDLFFLSENGQMEQIAHNMFAMLRTLDKGGYSTLFVELPPRAGLGEALHDRLRRAAAR